MKRKILCAKKGNFLFAIIPNGPEIGFYGYKINIKKWKIYTYYDNGAQWNSLQKLTDIHIELFKDVWNINEKLWKECDEEEIKFFKKIGLVYKIYL